jgi:hypothetical protein
MREDGKTSDIQKIYFRIHKGIATPTIVPLGSFIITG